MPPQTQQLVKKLQEQLKRKTIRVPLPDGTGSTSVPPSWYDLLRLHLVSHDFSQILEELLRISSENYLPQRFTPPLKLVMRPFQLCPPEQVRVVVIVPGPWSQLEQADGLALSSRPIKSVTGEVPRELLETLEAIRIQFGQAERGTPDLARWANQGVLLLNQGLTIQLDKGERSLREHQLIWQPFFRAVLDVLLDKMPHVPVILYQSSRQLLDDFPATQATYAGHFPLSAWQVNQEFIRQGLVPIQW